MPKDNPEEIIKQPKSENVNDLFMEALGDINDIEPEVQPHAIEAEEARQKEAAEAVTAPTDKNEKFDPRIHVTGKDGKPSVTKTGKFRKKKGVVIPDDMKEKSQEQIELERAEEKRKADTLGAAEVVQTLKRKSYDVFLDYKYGDDQHKLLVGCTYEYLESLGGAKLTPLQALMIHEGFLLVGALQTEKASKKITGIKAWFAAKYVKFKDRKKAKQNDSQSSGRTNTKRKNNANDETGEKQEN